MMTSMTRLACSVLISRHKRSHLEDLRAPARGTSDIVVWSWCDINTENLELLTLGHGHRGLTSGDIRPGGLIKGEREMQRGHDL